MLYSHLIYPEKSSAHIIPELQICFQTDKGGFFVKHPETEFDTNERIISIITDLTNLTRNYKPGIINIGNLKIKIAPSS